MNPPYRCFRYTPSDTSIATSIFLVPGSILPSTPHSLFSIAESSRSSLGNRLKWLVSNPSSPTHSLTEDHGSTCTSDRTLSGVRDLFFRRLLEFSLGGNYRYHRIRMPTSLFRLSDTTSAFSSLLQFMRQHTTDTRRGSLYETRRREREKISCPAFNGSTSRREKFKTDVCRWSLAAGISSFPFFDMYFLCIPLHLDFVNERKKLVNPIGVTSPSTL